MSGNAAALVEPAPIVACTISRNVQEFDLLIEDMESELGESWGDLSIDDALAFFGQPDAESLEFIAVAMDEIVRAEPNATFGLDQRVRVEIEPLRGNTCRFVEPLENAGRRVECAERITNGEAPFFRRKIASEVNAAGSPGVF